MRALVFSVYLLMLVACAANKPLVRDYAEIPETSQGTLTKALQGDPAAQEAIGELYHYGLDGVEKSYSKAYSWYRLAAEQGYASSQDYLGLFYAGGLGVTKSCGEAIKWFENAYFNGWIESKGNLVWMLATCEDDARRDGKLALQLAIEDLQEHGVTTNRLDNYAAALAETGNFVKAIEVQEKLIAAVRAAGGGADLQGFVDRLRAYRLGMPWRGASYDSPEDYAND